MSDRQHISTGLMMESFRRAMTPDQASAFVRENGQGRGNSLTQRAMMVAGYDALICGGFVTRSDVYFSAPPAIRESVLLLSKARGQVWSPGERGGLHRATRDQYPEISALDMEVCVRYGPLESLVGDLYANLRRYELLLWGFLAGVLATHYGDTQGDWRSTPWWKLGTPEADRRRLTAEWGDRPDVDRPWRLATFGSMEKIIDKNRALIARIGRDPDSRAFAIEVGKVAHIRNSVMHPLSEKLPAEDDFTFVTSSLSRLARRVASALATAALDPAFLPSLNTLMMPRILDEQLFPGGVEAWPQRMS